MQTHFPDEWWEMTLGVHGALLTHSCLDYNDMQAHLELMTGRRTRRRRRTSSGWSSTCFVSGEGWQVQMTLLKHLSRKQWATIKGRCWSEVYKEDHQRPFSTFPVRQLHKYTHSQNYRHRSKHSRRSTLMFGLNLHPLCVACGWLRIYCKGLMPKLHFQPHTPGQGVCSEDV